MTHSEVEAFLTVVRCGSLTAAAEKLYITQPALSRRIGALEEELRCRLFSRRKGGRSVELTEEGAAFQPLAEKWLRLWREAQSLPLRGGQSRLRLAAIGSVSTYLLPDIFLHYLRRNPQAELIFHCYHSREAYGYVEEGACEFAFVSDLQFSRQVTARPLFRDEMLLVSSLPAGDGAPVRTETLDPRKEIRVPWNPEYDAWHAVHFEERSAPRVFLDEMSMMEGFLTEDAWSIVPASVAEKLRGRGLTVSRLAGGPPERIVYGLHREGDPSPALEGFLRQAREEISAIPGTGVYAENWL